MDEEFSITKQGNQYQAASFTFPGGEQQVSIPGLPNKLTGDVTVSSRLQSSAALIRLLLTTEVLSRVHRDGRKRLVVPYFPYARQDRVMRPCEAFSLKAIARLINSLGFDEVVTCDPHSDVTPALVENIRIIPQAELVARHEQLQELLWEEKPVVVAPDAGAAKKAFAVAQRFKLPLLTASKIRDTATGEITRTELHGATDGPALIVDDICDGGRTFIELAKVLRENGAKKVYLYVTHGIFSQGLDVFAGLIDGIFTTDTFLSAHIPDRLPFPFHISKVHF
jgi:ribose-phosphate pyrophosphokinase